MSTTKPAHITRDRIAMMIDSASELQLTKIMIPEIRKRMAPAPMKNLRNHGPGSSEIKKRITMVIRIIMYAGTV